MHIHKVTLIGLGAMGVFFAPRLSAYLGENFRVLATGERKERLIFFHACIHRYGRWYR